MNDDQLTTIDDDTLDQVTGGAPATFDEFLVAAAGEFNKGVRDLTIVAYVSLLRLFGYNINF